MSKPSEERNSNTHQHESEPRFTILFNSIGAAMQSLHKLPSMKPSSFLLFFIAIIYFSPVVKAQNITDTAMNVHINHIAVYVFDLKKSRAFYEDVVHLKRIEEPFKDGLHAWFAIGGGVQLHLIQGAKEIIEHVQNTHICFSGASVEPFVANLKKMNISYFNAKGEPGIITVRVDGVKQIYFKDPDGYWIEINDAKN